MTNRTNLEMILFSADAPGALLREYPQIRTRANALSLIFTADNIEQDMRSIEGKPRGVYSVYPGHTLCLHWDIPGRIDIGADAEGRLAVVGSGVAGNVTARAVRRVLKAVDDFLWFVTGGSKR